MKKIFFVFIFLIACSHTETVIKDRKVEITVPGFSDTSIVAEIKNVPEAKRDSIHSIINELPDSLLFEGTKVITTAKGDKVKVYVNYSPKKGTFTVDIPSFKVDTVITDTTKYTIKKETTTSEKFGYMFYGVIGALVIAVVGFFAFRKFRNG